MEGFGEVGNRFSLPLMGMVFDHQAQDIAAPPLFDRLPHIPKSGWKVFHL